MVTPGDLATGVAHRFDASSPNAGRGGRSATITTRFPIRALAFPILRRRAAAPGSFGLIAARKTDRDRMALDPGKLRDRASARAPTTPVQSARYSRDCRPQRFKGQIRSKARLRIEIVGLD